jgi:hypothetical protein
MEVFIPLFWISSGLAVFIVWLIVELRRGPEWARVTLAIVFMGILLFARVKNESRDRLFAQKVLFRNAMENIHEQLDRGNYAKIKKALEAYDQKKFSNTEEAFDQLVRVFRAEG